MRRQGERSKQGMYTTPYYQGACTAESTVLAWLIRPTVGQGPRVYIHKITQSSCGFLSMRFISHTRVYIRIYIHVYIQLRLDITSVHVDSTQATLIVNTCT